MSGDIGWVDLVVGSGGWKWIKVAPTLLPDFDPSEKRILEVLNRICKDD